ncbi:hypothetical protein JZ751_012094 [Albula glossodonta]|uniref:FIP-RBD domain-containing protein n=1 Tax=Albula glossodonta TaxID=121402 RepID=A0A8T2PRI5_9TELE|nr:hypothetical protein JZ751_012094 [Albula glossodonta]
MRNNMTASMFDLSTQGKSRSRMGKLKDKIRGKKGGLSDSASAIVPAFSSLAGDSQVMTDSEGDGEGLEDEQGDKKKKKKSKLKSLFVPKSNLQRNVSQSMSTLGTLPERNSALSGSQSSGLNVDSPEGKKKFKFLTHKRTGSSDSKSSHGIPSLLGRSKQGAAEQSGVCINGSHVYMETPLASSTLSLNSSNQGSMEDLQQGQLRSSSTRDLSLSLPEEQDHYSEEEENREEQERIRLEEQERKMREEEEERKRREKELERRRFEQEKDRMRQEEELDRMRREEELERKRLEEELERKRREEELERKRVQEEQERKKLEEELERKRREEEQEMMRLEEEKKRREEELERRRVEEEEQERVRNELERKRREEEQEMRRQEEEKRRREEEVEKKRLEEEQERKREEEERKRLKEELEMMKLQEQQERKRKEEEMERKELEMRLFEEEQERKRREEELERKELEMRLFEEEQERKRREEELEMMKLQEEQERKRGEEQMERKELEMRLFEEEQERKRREEELERHRVEEEQERRNREEELEMRRLEEEQERMRDELERKKREEDLEMRRLEEEQERKRREEELEMRRMEEELERKRLEEEKEWKRRREEEQEMRRLEEEQEKKKREEEMKMFEEQERVRKEKDKEMRSMEEEQERNRLEQEKERKREELENKRLEEARKDELKQVNEAEMKVEEVSMHNPFREASFCNPFEDVSNSNPFEDVSNSMPFEENHHTQSTSPAVRSARISTVKPRLDMSSETGTDKISSSLPPASTISSSLPSPPPSSSGSSISSVQSQTPITPVEPHSLHGQRSSEEPFTGDVESVLVKGFPAAHAEKKRRAPLPPGPQASPLSTPEKRPPTQRTLPATPIQGEPQPPPPSQKPTPAPRVPSAASVRPRKGPAPPKPQHTVPTAGPSPGGMQKSSDKQSGTLENPSVQQQQAEDGSKDASLTNPNQEGVLKHPGSDVVAKERTEKTVLTHETDSHLLTPKTPFDDEDDADTEYEALNLKGHGANVTEDTLVINSDLLPPSGVHTENNHTSEVRLLEQSGGQVILTEEKQKLVPGVLLSQDHKAREELNSREQGTTVVPKGKLLTMSEEDHCFTQCNESLLLKSVASDMAEPPESGMGTDDHAGHGPMGVPKKKNRAPPPPGSSDSSKEEMGGNCTSQGVDDSVMTEPAVLNSAAPSESQKTAVAGKRRAPQPGGVISRGRTLLRAWVSPSESQPVRMQGHAVQPVAAQSSGDAHGAGGKAGGLSTAPRRPHPVKPLSSLESHPPASSPGGDLGGTELKTKGGETMGGGGGPYSQLTQAELVSLVVKQQDQLSQKDVKIKELEEYIDNLLVRIIEEQPSILQSMNSLKKSI